MPKRRSTGPTVAVLGAGIMGSSVALWLARRGIGSVLIDAAPRPFSGASRWNEGKIHLGYLYGADPTLETARKLLPGGLLFFALLRELLDRDLGDRVVTQHDDRYLLHRNSVADPDQVWGLARRISALVQEHPDADRYAVPLRRLAPRRLEAREIEAEYDTSEIVAGIAVPERSVATQPIADAFVQTLEASSRIQWLMGHRVLQVRERRGGWTVHARDDAGEAHALGPFRAVVNALWEGRGAVDASVGLPTPEVWTHRYRVSLFARTKRPTDLRSAVVAVGPFGDVKNYDGQDLYLSWYETGLLVESNALEPPRVAPLSAAAEERVVQETLQKLGRLMPAVRALRGELQSVAVRGGWVYAAGRGALSSPRSDLHRRDRVGSQALRGYFSVDTGKYSIAPWLAVGLADAVAEVLGKTPCGRPDTPRSCP